MVPFGKRSFTTEALAENFRAVYEAIEAAKPASTKGIYIKRCTIATTMGPGLHVDVKEPAAA
jgi:large subunit ribosomal protein L1